MRRFLIVVAAGALLLVGATTVLAAPTTSGPASVVQAGLAGAGSVLSDVLDDLVGAGTITQAQADTIEQAVEARRTELQAERDRLREQMRTFLEDGVLSADELAQLPADSPLRNLDQYLEDGQLTQDELRALRGLGGFGHRGGWLREGGPGASGSSDSSSGTQS
jgi:hypothetical protein